MWMRGGVHGFERIMIHGRWWVTFECFDLLVLLLHSRVQEINGLS